MENTSLGAHCRYCGAPLVQPESVLRGYGRRCAEEHHQPWGAQGDVPGRVHREDALDRASVLRRQAEAEWDESQPGDPLTQWRRRHPNRQAA